LLQEAQVLRRQLLRAQLQVAVGAQGLQELGLRRLLLAHPQVRDREIEVRAPQLARLLAGGLKPAHHGVQRQDRGVEVTFLGLLDPALQLTVRFLALQGMGTAGKQQREQDGDGFLEHGSLLL
jgi:hypothetical protein